MNVRDNSSSGQSLTPTGVGLFRPADEQQLHTSSFVKGVEIDDLDRLQRRAGKHANDLLAAPGALLVPLVDLPRTRACPTRVRARNVVAISRWKSSPSARKGSSMPHTAG